MKKVFLFLVLTSIGFSIIFFSCKKDQPNLGNEDNETIAIEKYGEIHNEVLDLYYKKVGLKGTQSLDEKIKYIDECLSQVVDDIEEGSFASIVNSNQFNVRSNIELISNSENDFETGSIIINELYDNNQITENEREYYYTILNTYEIYSSNLATLKVKLQEIENTILFDELITQFEKNNLLKVTSISISSVEYWELDTKNLTTKASIPSWIAKDCVGAVTSVQTGLTGYATILFGPVGGAITTLGAAAVCSAIE